MNLDPSQGPPSARARTCAPPGHWLRQSLFLLRAALREIFDESSYARFLARRQLVSSPRAYAAFLREDELAKVCRPRCC